MVNLTPLIQSEFIKIKGSKISLFLIFFGYCFALMMAFIQARSDNSDIINEFSSLWMAPSHALIVLYLPYVMTQEKTFRTEKWLYITQTRYWEIILSKWVTCFLIALVLQITASIFFLPNDYTLQRLLLDISSWLASSIAFTLMSLLITNISALFAFIVVGSLISQTIYKILPLSMKGIIGSMFPGMELSNFADIVNMPWRVISISIMIIAIATIALFRSKKW